MSEGPLPTLMAATVTLLVAVSILVTVPAPALVTNTRVPSGVTATPLGFAPTLIVASTDLVVVSMTERVPAALLVT